MPTGDDVRRFRELLKREFDGAGDLEVKSLLMAWLCYQTLVERRDIVTVAQVAEWCGMRELEHQFRRSMKEVAEKVPSAAGFYESGQGSRRTVVHHRFRPVFQRIKRILELYGELTARPAPQARIGVSLSLCSRLIPEVLKRFQAAFQHEHPEWQVDVAHGQPQQLRQQSEAGEFDLMATSCPPDYEEGVVHEEWLRPYLIFSKEDPIGEPFAWNMLSGKTVILLEGRTPLPDYPIQELTQEKVKFLHVQSYPEAHALVAGFHGSAVSFSFPQLWGPMEQSFLGWVSAGPKPPPVRMCLVRSAQANRAGPPEEAEAIDCLQEIFRTCITGLNAALHERG